MLTIVLAIVKHSGKTIPGKDTELMDENYTKFVDKQGEDIVADVFIERD